MKFIIPTLLIALCSLVVADPLVIDDRKILKDFEKQIGKALEDEFAAPGKKLMTQLKENKKAKIKLPDGENLKLSGDLYKNIAPSVFIISSVFKCDHCDKWHRSGAASAWALTEDGVMVTNYHVFMKAASQGAFGVVSITGEVFPVSEILAASQKSDVAIFRVKGSGFRPLPLKPKAAVGSNVNIIGHPDGRFFTYTSGRISRYFRLQQQNSGIWMHITAEYAKGSSGSPIFNDQGQVVGMASSTSSIYYDTQKKDDQRRLQMVIRNCPPAQLILDLIDAQ